MNHHQELEEVKLKTEADFTYAGLRIVMGYRRDGVESWNDALMPFVEVFWKNFLLGKYESLPVAVLEAFNAVRVCRPGITETIGDDRPAALIALMSLGELIGVQLGLFSDLPEVPTRMHPESDRLREAFKHWDDRPQVMVYASMSSIDRQNYRNEAVRYRIRMTTSRTSFEHEVNMPSWKTIDLDDLLVDLMIKHFS